MGLEDTGGNDNRPDGPSSPWPGDATPPAKPVIEPKPAPPKKPRKPKGKAK